MIPLHDLLLFSGAALLMVLTPGPNMLYLISRTVCQGRQAGLFSLAGVVAGFLVHMLAAALGLTALFLAVPLAYDVLKWLGALYLLWLAWKAWQANGTAFQVQTLTADAPRRLWLMGFLTNVLNPKMAFFYVAIFPQFVVPDKGLVWQQSVILGFTQIGISLSVNLLIVLSAARLASWFNQRPRGLGWQRYVMSGVLVTLAFKLLLSPKRLN